MRMHFALHALPIACPKFVLLDRYSRAEEIGNAAVLTDQVNNSFNTNVAKLAYQIGSCK